MTMHVRGGVNAAGQHRGAAPAPSTAQRARSAPVALFPVAALAGCGATPSRDHAPGVRAVAFACTDGGSLSVRFEPARRVAVLHRDGRHCELAQQPTGSGILYRRGSRMLRGKGAARTA